MIKGDVGLYNDYNNAFMLNLTLYTNLSCFWAWVITGKCPSMTEYIYTYYNFLCLFM